MWGRTQDPKTMKRNTVTASRPRPISIVKRLIGPETWLSPELGCILSLWQHSRGKKKSNLVEAPFLLSHFFTDSSAWPACSAAFYQACGRVYIIKEGHSREKTTRLSASKKEREGEDEPGLYTSEVLMLYFLLSISLPIQVKRWDYSLSQSYPSLLISIVLRIKPSTYEFCVGVPYS